MMWKYLHDQDGGDINEKHNSHSIVELWNSQDPYQSQLSQI